MKRQNAIKLFGLNNLLIESEICSLEKKLEVDLGHRQTNKQSIDEKYYPQFPEKLRSEARSMANSYVVFYCLENSIRELIVSRLSDPLEFGNEWWKLGVPDVVRVNAEKNMKKELASGITPRSAEPIDYTNFGELGEIIKRNWEIFGDTLTDIRAVERIMANLNTLRALIAHCKPLAEDEELRLHLTLRDWFRQMS